MKSPLDLIINGAMKDEVFLDLDLLKMTKMTEPVWSIGLMVCLYPKSMRAHYELA
jgi:hypothetical protein